MDVKGGEAVHLNLVNEEVRFIRWNVLALIPGEVMPRIGPIDKRIGTDGTVKSYAQNRFADSG